MRWAVPLGLVFGRNSNPDPDRFSVFWCGIRCFHGLLFNAFCDTESIEKQFFFVTQKQKISIGRPKLPETEARSIFISTRLSAEENDQIKEAIHRSGKTQSDWIREVLLEKANKL
jgi:hypothetical protein